MSFITSSKRGQCAGAWFRNQVYCRFAYCRVAIFPSVAAWSRVNSPSNIAEISRTPIARITGASPGRLSLSNAATSFTAPPSIMASNRWSQRAYNQALCGKSSTGFKVMSAPIPPTFSCRQLKMLRPVDWITSSARAIRLLSVGANAAAA